MNIQNQKQNNFKMAINPIERKEIQQLVDNLITEVNNLLLTYQAKQKEVPNSVIAAMGLPKQPAVKGAERLAIDRQVEISELSEEIEQFKSSMPTKIFTEKADFMNTKNFVRDFCKTSKLKLMLIESKELPPNDFIYLKWPEKNFKYRLKWDVSSAVIHIESMSTNVNDRDFINGSNFKFLNITTVDNVNIFRIDVGEYVKLSPYNLNPDEIQISPSRLS